MVDSRVKGAKAETVVRDALRAATGLKWERTPSSGALDAKHGLKGDLYIPNVTNTYCVEVKHYAEDHFTSSIITAKEPVFLDWWLQTVSQANLVDRKPLLIFKYDRSKLFAAYEDFPEADYMYVYVNDYKNTPCYVSLLDDFLLYNAPKFIK